MARVFNPRYSLTKLRAALEAAASGLQSSSLATAINRGMQAYEKQLTTTMMITGAAMLPTLNPKADSQSDAVERLLVRLIPRPAANKTVFEGDVVAFVSPFVAPVAAQPAGEEGDAAQRWQHVMVRRLAALPGEELTTGEDEDAEGYTLPEGMCWVLADNEKLSPPDVTDSRSFGPLPLANIIGRILYAARSESDHGPVENSEEGMAQDAPVVEMELDIDRLCTSGEGCST